MEYCSEVEKKIINRVIADAIATGYSISVNDGEETTLHNSKNAVAIRKEVAATEETVFTFYAADGASVGWVYFIHGNECDVISDSNVGKTIDAILHGASELATTL